ncbi:MAG: rhomboid family intramembrane serine protease [Clostridia bacterium]|nr:rhomboid family intramembrane serine protease [Clostridia bacterium]MCI1999709.1 rhomboid family intramembrane serine protease [Clostridia bacterium]MCI2013912.1 rhomboid family intramembrane serine protease [Clostridia bacterium]
MRMKRISFNSPVILTFSFICLVTLILGAVTNGKTTELFFCVYRAPLTDPFTYVRLICHVFGHAGWAHFSSNITMLLLIGPMLEEKYGSANIILVMFITAFLTGIINMLLFPHTALLGASGIVFAFIIMSSLTDMKFGKIPLTFILISIIYIGGQVYSALFVQDNISNVTHIIGGIIGGFVGFTLNRK